MWKATLILYKTEQIKHCYKTDCVPQVEDSSHLHSNVLSVTTKYTPLQLIQI